jgi:RNA recognition motif-containing protein
MVLWNSESTSIPTNPRTGRPVGYAFVDLATATEAERAISELSGKEVQSRKVSVQLARRPETAAEKAEHAAANAEAADAGAEGRRRGSGRGRGRGRARAGRGGRGGRVSFVDWRKLIWSPYLTRIERQNDETPAVLPLTDTTKEASNAQNVENGNATADAASPSTAKDSKPRTPRQPKQRGPPEDGIPSKNKVMVANLPYDLSEEKVRVYPSTTILTC